MTQKPMLRVEVGALGAHQVKNMRVEGSTGAKVQGACLGGCGHLAPTGPLTVFLNGYSSCLFLGDELSNVTGFSYRLPPTRRRRFLALEQKGLGMMRLMFPACRVDSIEVLIRRRRTYSCHGRRRTRRGPTGETQPLRQQDSHKRGQQQHLRHSAPRTRKT